MHSSILCFLLDLLHNAGHRDLCEGGCLQCGVLHLSGDSAAAESTPKRPALAGLLHPPHSHVTGAVSPVSRVPAWGLYRYLAFVFYIILSYHKYFGLIAL